MKEYEKIIQEACDEYKVKNVELISSNEESYIGRRSFKCTLNNGVVKNCDQITKRKMNGDAVIIVPITKNGNFVMIAESRPLTKEEVVVEFPAGMIDENEDAIVAAKRELLEETGYEASDVKELEWHYQDQGCSKAVIKTYVALDCEKVKEQHLDHDECLKFIEVSVEEAIDMMFNDGGLIKDANTKIALLEWIVKNR